MHYLRDVADSAKLVAAMARLEDDGQETCYDPVVIVGGGYVAMETAAALVRGAPDLQVTMVIPGDHVLPSLFDPAQYAMASGGRDDDDDGGDGGAGASTGGAGSEPEKKDAGATNPDKLVAGVDKPSIIAEFYERQLVKAGVRFVRAHSVDRLWAVGEVGNFPTMEGPAISLQKTRPRPFGKAQPQFQQCRGVVLKSAHGGALAWLPARFVVLGLGATPNAELFASQLETARDGSLAVDENLCASHVSHDVFAAGDVATFPSPALQCNARLAHATCARAAGAYAARAMLDLAAGLEPFDPVPRITSRLLDLSWQFDGRTDGDVVVLGIDTFLSNKTFGAFWVHTHEGESRVVGVFLEGGTAAQREAAKQVAAECPRVINVRKLKRCGLEAFLADPGCLTPPQLAPGEFLAELDDEIVLEAFKRHDLAGQNTVKTGALGAIMRDLGADWDEDEVREAGIAMDPTGQGTVDYQTFLGWWMH